MRVDCDANPSDPTCGGNSTDIPEANVRLANLYEDDIVSWTSVMSSYASLT